MEEQLAAYRAKKAKERSSNSQVSGGLFGIGGGPFFRNRQKDATEKDTTKRVEDENMKSEEERDNADATMQKDDENSTDARTNVTPQSFSSKPYSTSTINPYRLALKAVLWLALFGLFVCIGFGAVYVILSLFYIIYANMRGAGEKTPGEKSAYSVFNPKCERIHGTLTAEEIEKGMIYGIGGAMR
ncbi:uncharacterized protein LOC576237 [Strongylocentrotus purpuratus]|uniref:SAYSvFN domain-containing protein n=1 Tax=Strongylocentrotus purpuratus TaxID=7668 RepID=A0A7M7RD45_STRPU|nr:uncharacterized protein LOC576237 [Strongylocentrotus purpuratus]|eukprot:XP_781658.1 PREDICTED: uncharacterized protein LOC576237 [Strongylocentrotus purpuratus]